MFDKKRVLALCIAAAAGLVCATPASADTVGPAVKYFKAPIPLIGGVLSDSSGTPSFSIKNGWSVNDGDGICAASTTLYRSYPDYTTSTVWSAPTTGKSVTSLSANHTWTTKVGRYEYLNTSATDCLGNSRSSAYSSVASSLAQETAASYGAGWTTAACSCFSGGAVMQSSKVGATANFSFSDSALVSLVSNRATSRGTVSLSVDGGAPVNVSLGGATLNRRIVWNSKYLNASGSHLLTVKVVSGRVDIDGFLTQ